jgi:hypothetical protein
MAGMAEIPIARSARPLDGPQPERDENEEGRKRAEKGQKMADGTNRALNFSFDFRGLGWLAKSISRLTFSGP